MKEGNDKNKKKENRLIKGGKEEHGKEKEKKREKERERERERKKKR